MLVMNNKIIVKARETLNRATLLIIIGSGVFVTSVFFTCPSRALIIAGFISAFVSFCVLVPSWRARSKVGLWAFVATLCICYQLSRQLCLISPDQKIGEIVLFIVQWTSLMQFAFCTLLFLLKRHILAFCFLNEEAEQDGPPNDPPSGSFEGGPV